MTFPTEKTLKEIQDAYPLSQQATQSEQSNTTRITKRKLSLRQRLVPNRDSSRESKSEMAEDDTSKEPPKQIQHGKPRGRPRGRPKGSKNAQKDRAGDKPEADPKIDNRKSMIEYEINTKRFVLESEARLIKTVHNISDTIRNAFKEVQTSLTKRMGEMESKMESLSGKRHNVEYNPKATQAQQSDDHPESEENRGEAFREEDPFDNSMTANQLTGTQIKNYNINYGRLESEIRYGWHETTKRSIFTDNILKKLQTYKDSALSSNGKRLLESPTYQEPLPNKRRHLSETSNDRYKWSAPTKKSTIKPMMTVGLKEDPKMRNSTKKSGDTDNMPTEDSNVTQSLKRQGTLPFKTSPGGLKNGYGLLITDNFNVGVSLEKFTPTGVKWIQLNCEAMDGIPNCVNNSMLAGKCFDIIILCVGDVDVESADDKKWESDIEAALEALMHTSAASPIILSMPVGKQGHTEKDFPIKRYRMLIQQTCEDRSARITYAYHRNCIGKNGNPLTKALSKTDHELSNAGKKLVEEELGAVLMRALDRFDILNN